MKCNTCGGLFAGFEECPVCQPSIRQCPLCFGNGKVRQEECNPLEVIAEQKELLDKMADTVDIVMRQNDTIRLLREDAIRLEKWAEKYRKESEHTGIFDSILFNDLSAHKRLIKQLDEQEAEK